MIQPTEAMHLSIRHIKTLMKAGAIICYGQSYKTTNHYSFFNNPEKSKPVTHDHYDYLVISQNKTAVQPGELLESGKPESATPYSCSLIVHTPDEVIQGLKENNRFFHALMNKTLWRYCKPHFLNETHSYIFKPKNDRLLTLKNSHAYEEQLETYAQIAYASQSPHICVPLFSAQLEHACLLLIYVVMGYEPQNYTLRGLLNLCNTIDSRFEKIIPTITEDDCYHYHLLEKGIWKGKYGRDREPVVAYLHKACDDFTSLVKEITKAKLNSLKLLN